MTKSQDENLIILRKKRAFKRNEKAFFINFKGLSLKQIKQIFFGRWEPDFKDVCGRFDDYFKSLTIRKVFVAYKKGVIIRKIMKDCKNKQELVIIMAVVKKRLRNTLRIIKKDWMSLHKIDIETYLWKKVVKIEHGRNRYRKMSEEDKLKLKVYQKDHRKNKL